MANFIKLTRAYDDNVDDEQCLINLDTIIMVEPAEEGYIRIVFNTATSSKPITLLFKESFSEFEAIAKLRIVF
jgi:hypothetical protein